MLVALAFLAGVAFTAALATVTVLLMVKLDLIQDHRQAAQQAARLDAHEKWTRDKADELNSGLVQLGLVLEKLSHKVSEGDMGYQPHGEEIPSGRELIGSVEGMGQDG